MPKPIKKIEQLSPFQTFKRFTKALLAVPRKELQEKLAKHKRDKSKKRR